LFFCLEIAGSGDGGPKYLYCSAEEKKKGNREGGFISRPATGNRPPFFIFSFGGEGGEKKGKGHPPFPAGVRKKKIADHNSKRQYALLPSKGKRKKEGGGEGIVIKKRIARAFSHPERVSPRKRKKREKEKKKGRGRSGPLLSYQQPTYRGMIRPEYSTHTLNYTSRGREGRERGMAIKRKSHKCRRRLCFSANEFQEDGI